MSPTFRPAVAATLIGLLGSCSLQRPEARYSWVRPLNERTADGDAGTSPSVPPPLASPPWEQPLSAGLVDVAPTNDRGFSTIPAPPPVVVPGNSPLKQAAHRPSPTPVVLTQDTGYYRPDEPRGWNGVAVAALPVTVAGIVLAIALQSTLLLGVVGVVGFTLGLIGARRARDRDRRGKGFAIPALIIGTLALLLTVLSLVLGG